MSNLKLEIQRGGKSRRVSLQPGLTRIGSPDAPGVDIGVNGVDGELHVWDSPPKVVRVQGDAALVVDGDSVEESTLDEGTFFAWCGTKFTFLVLPPVLEEIVDAPPVATRAVGTGAAASAGGFSAGDAAAQKAWDRVAAGLLVETGLADKGITKRWQAAVVQNEWDADACARDILGASREGLSNPRIVERAGRLERDLVMASFQRGMKGASRRARGAARNTTAFVVANVLAIAVYSAIILALLIIARVNYDWSLDGIVDRMVGAVKGLF